MCTGGSGRELICGSYVVAITTSHISQFECVANYVTYNCAARVSIGDSSRSSNAAIIFSGLLLLSSEDDESPELNYIHVHTCTYIHTYIHTNSLY